MNNELESSIIKDMSNEELVHNIQKTNDDIYWRELEKRTEKTYSFVLREYVHSYYKETMREDILSILKIGWVKAVQSYKTEKATADFVSFCIFIMRQHYIMFARRIKEDKIGNSVRDEVMSNVNVDAYDNTEKMIQGCMEYIMKCETNSYDEIENKDYIRDMLSRLKQYDKLQYTIIKRHLIDGITQKDLGKQLKISQSAVSRQIKKGINFLKEAMTQEMF